MMRKTKLMAAGITLLLLIPACDHKPVTVLPDPTNEVLERRFGNLRKEIRDVQRRTRKLVDKLVTEIHENKVDVNSTLDEVRQTTEEVKTLRNKVKKLQNQPPSRQPGPLT